MANMLNFPLRINLNLGQAYCLINSIQNNKWLARLNFFLRLQYYSGVVLGMDS